EKLVGLAADEEDVALSAFDSFCRAAEQGRFPRLADRNGLWRLLVVLTARKAADLRQHEGRRKRGGGAPDAAGAPGRLAAAAPPPEVAAQLVEEGLRPVALWRMEGDTVEEIAGRLGCAPRSVERKLRVIRGLWTEGEGTP